MGRSRVRVALAAAVTLVVGATIALGAGALSSQAKEHSVAAGTSPRGVGAVAGFAAPVMVDSDGTASQGMSSVTWIGAPTTGFTASTALRIIQGDVTITQPGTVLDGVDIRGFVFVQAPNVVIRNSIIRGRASSSSIGLVMANSSAGTNLLIEDSEIAAAVPSAYLNGIMGGNFTLRRVNIHGVIDPVHIYGNNVLIESSWLHDNLHYDNDPARGGGPSHDDSVQIQKGDNIRLVGNYLSGSHNAAIQVTQDQGTVTNLQISGNYLDNGGCTVNIADKGRAGMANVSITDNVFGPNRAFSGCSVVVSPTTPAPTMFDNVFSDGVSAGIRRQ